MPKMSSAQWKFVLRALSAICMAVVAFKPEWSHFLGEGSVVGLALAAGFKAGVTVNGPGQVSVTTHPDDLP